MSGQLGATAADLAGDVRAGQPDCPGGSEAAVEIHSTSLYSIGDQRVAVLVSARQLGAAAREVAGDVRPR